MLGNYEKRQFAEGEKIWFGRYKNLSNVLHWHFECEIIRIVRGTAQIKIGNLYFEAVQGDCFFCASEELHYIISEPDSEIDIAIFDKTLTKDITDQYTVLSPKLPHTISIETPFERIKQELHQKAQFYREALEIEAKSLIIDIFRNCPATKRKQKEPSHKNLITKINNEFSFITFDDAVRFSGYSPSHFSKMFKKLSGMAFSEYLNILKVEYAILLLRENETITMSDVSAKCGFSTIRNFNRVFKNITGFSPHALPKDFIIDSGLRIAKTENFDPTDKKSVLI